jgi:hypothetical protein
MSMLAARYGRWSARDKSWPIHKVEVGAIVAQA